jgi:DNA-binding winged helix-turn-helix (wHTH) protein
MTVPMPEMANHPDGFRYTFGSFCLLPDGTLLRDASEIHLPPKELAVLRVLISHSGQIVSPEKLRLSAWGDTHVSADSLPRCVSSLRAHLDSELCIQTIYKRGYRFTLPVHRTDPASRAEQFSATRQIDRPDQRIAHPAGLPRLAILPFTTADDVPDLLGTGIVEETMIRLSRAHNPAVEMLARDSVFHLAARGATAQEVGATLGADLVLAGWITPLPLHFRLRIEMICVADAIQLWIEDFLVSRALLASASTRTAGHISARIHNTFATAISPAAASFAANGSTVNRVTAPEQSEPEDHFRGHLGGMSLAQPQTSPESQEIP